MRVPHRVLSLSVRAHPASDCAPEFIAAQCRLADSIGGLRQRPLRHVAAHPNIPDAFSQKLFFTIVFRHFRTLANQRIKTRYRISKRMKMA